MRTPVKKQLSSRTLENLNQTELTSRQEQFIDFMAEKPHVFLGVMAEGNQTPDDLITDMLWDRYARDWMEREISFEKAEPYFEAGIIEPDDVETLLEQDIEPEKLEQQATPELFQRAGKSEKELERIKEDFDGLGSVTHSISTIYGSGYISLEDVILMCK